MWRHNPHHVGNNLAIRTLTIIYKLNHRNSTLQVDGSSFRRIMTSCGESCCSSEVTRLIAYLIIRSTANMGTWNVWTVWKTGRTSLVAAEMRRWNLTVLRISKTHWTQKCTEKDRFRRDAAVLWSRRGKCSTYSGSCSDAIKKTRKTLIGQESHGSRIIRALF